MNSEYQHGSTDTGLDPSFADQGIANLQSPAPLYPEYTTQVVAVGPDHKVYIAGRASEGLNYSVHTLTRLTDAGLLDTTFGDNGHFSGYFYKSDRSSFFAEQIAFTGVKILVTGYLFHYENGALRRDAAAVRFLENGTIDETFGEQGKFVFYTPDLDADTSLSTAYHEKLLDDASLRSGSRHPRTIYPGNAYQNTPVSEEHIFLLHHSGNFVNQHSWIIRITQHGLLDTTFNESGFVRVRHPIYPRLRLSSLTIDDDGNYICSGEVRVNYSSFPDAIVMVKHDKNGNLDTSFQQNGFLQIMHETPGHFFLLEKTVKQPNNRLLCLGLALNNDQSELSAVLISREVDGSSNIQFNSGKPVFTTINSSSAAWTNAQFQPNGSFLTAGLVNIEDSSKTHYVVSRFLDNGTLDKNFGNGTGSLIFEQATNFVYHSSAFTESKVLFDIQSYEPGAPFYDYAVGRALIP